MSGVSASVTAHTDWTPVVGPGVPAEAERVTASGFLPDPFDALGWGVIADRIVMAIGSNRSIRVSLATDNVFSDGSSQQLAILSGSLTDDLVAKLTIGI